MRASGLADPTVGLSALALRDPELAVAREDLVFQVPGGVLRDRGLGPREESISERMRELDEREAEIEGRWARLEADFELRVVKLVQRERTIGELGLRLGKKGSDLAQYVGG